MRRGLFFVIALAVILLHAVPWEAATQPSAPKTIAVGAVPSLSGITANLGHQAVAGYEIAAEDINKSGGVFVKEFGKKIPLEIIVQDSESDVNKAVSRMEWLYTSRNVVAYVGTTWIFGGVGVAEKNKIPTIAIAATQKGIHERGFKYWFSPVGKTPDAAKIIFDLLKSIAPDKQAKTVAFFQEQSDFGNEQTEDFRKEALEAGYKIAVHEKYAFLTKDYSRMILAAKNAGAELVLTTPVTPDAMAMLKQMKELDYNPKAVVVLRAADDLEWGKAMGSVGDGVLLYGSWHHAVKYPGVDKLNAAHRAKFGRPADMQTGPAYASIQILAAAIEKAGTLNTVKVRDAIAATDMMTVVGKVKFLPNGRIVDPCPAIIQWQAGKQELVWPKEFRTAPFVYPIPAWKER